MDSLAVAGVTSDRDLERGSRDIGLEHARSLVEMFARVTSSLDVDAFCEGFTEDCVVHYPPSLVATGREELREGMKKFFGANLPGFRCEKHLRAISGSVLGVIWISQWTDSESGKLQVRKGVEFWTMRGDQIARWDATSAICDAA